MIGESMIGEDETLANLRHAITIWPSSFLNSWSVGFDQPRFLQHSLSPDRSTIRTIPSLPYLVLCAADQYLKGAF